VRLSPVAPIVALIVGCSVFIPPAPTYDVPVAFQNHTRFEARLVISDDAFVMGEPTGSATPAQVPAFFTGHVVLHVPRSRAWALFVELLGQEPQDTSPRLRSSALGGCETFRLPIDVEVGVAGHSVHVPGDNC